MFKSKVLAAAAALTLAGGIGVLAAAPAGAATPSCGASCISLYPREYAAASIGDAPQFVMDVFRQGDRTGQPVILYRASNEDPAEDFTYATVGTVAGFYAAGLVSSSLALEYGCTRHRHGSTQTIQCTTPGQGDETAYQIEYAPYGVESGLCAGVATTAAAGTKVSLQPCGTSSKTTWVEDTQDSPAVPFYAAINGSDTSFSNPFVLTYPGNAYPTDVPRAQLVTEPLTGFSSSSGGTSNNDNQLWTGFTGSALP